MCLAIPGKIVEIDEEKGIVDLGGIRKQIALTFVPEAEVGDWILIHTGFGLNIISEAEALETLDLIKQAYGLEAISEPAADS